MTAAEINKIEQEIYFGHNVLRCGEYGINQYLEESEKKYYMEITEDKPPKKSGLGTIFSLQVELNKKDTQIAELKKQLEEKPTQELEELNAQPKALLKKAGEIIHLVHTAGLSDAKTAQEWATVLTLITGLSADRMRQHFLSDDLAPDVAKQHVDSIYSKKLQELKERAKSK